MRPGRSSTRTPSQRFSRLRVCAGVSSSSKTTSFARSSAAAAPISSTAPFPTNVAGSGAARSLTNRRDLDAAGRVEQPLELVEMLLRHGARHAARGRSRRERLSRAPEPSDRVNHGRIRTWTFSPRERLLGERLESLYRTYGPETASSDPIGLLAPYREPEDIEVAGWIAAAFAYGRVETIRANVSKRPRGARAAPGAALDEIRDFRAFARERLARFPPPIPRPVGRRGAPPRHRAASAKRRARSAPSSKRASDAEDADVAAMVSRVTQELRRLDYRPALGRRELPEDSPVRFFFPDPASGSACKRWNLYLRWMVRRDRARLRLVARHSDEPPDHSDRHAHSPRLAAPGPDAPEDRGRDRGAPDHPAARAVRSGRSGALRLRPLPRRDLRHLPQEPAAVALRRVPGPRGVPGRAAEDRRVKTRTLLALAFGVALASVARRLGQVARAAAVAVGIARVPVGRAESAS